MVIDTNVAAYSVLNVPGFASADAALARGGRIIVPELFLSELANVAWKHFAAGLVTYAAAWTAIQDGRRMVSRFVPVHTLWGEALELSCAVGHPVYDTLFIVLAKRHRTRLVTFDGPLADKFPSWTELLVATPTPAPKDTKKRKRK